MNDAPSNTPVYIHGNTPEEQKRLSRLNDLLNQACLRELNLKGEDSILDLGSGLGQFSRKMAQTLGGGAHVLGIERDPEQIAAARKLATEAGEQGLVDFREGDAASLPLAASEWGTFSLAHARFLLEHAPRPDRIVEQMARAVKPGGRVFLCDDDHGDFRPWPEPPGFPAMWRAYVGTFEANGCDPYVGRKLVSLLAGAGLTPVRNGVIFFGGCAGDDSFDATADNLIAAFLGAKQAMLSTDHLDETAFTAGLNALGAWKSDAASSLWYSACFAEGIAPI